MMSFYLCAAVETVFASKPAAKLSRKSAEWFLQKNILGASLLAYYSLGRINGTNLDDIFGQNL